MTIFTTYIYPIIVSIVVALIFFLIGRKGVRTGQEFIKNDSRGSYKKAEVYGIFKRGFKYYSIPLNDPKNFMKEITESEYNGVISEEKGFFR
jgi:hypothetical protein